VVEAACAEAVSQVIAELGAEKLKDTGRVTSELKHRYPAAGWTFARRARSSASSSTDATPASGRVPRTSPHGPH
jgi:hypothetical protein